MHYVKKNPLLIAGNNRGFTPHRFFEVTRCIVLTSFSVRKRVIVTCRMNWKIYYAETLRIGSADYGVPTRLYLMVYLLIEA